MKLSESLHLLSAKLDFLLGVEACPCWALLSFVTLSCVTSLAACVNAGSGAGGFGGGYGAAAPGGGYGAQQAYAQPAYGGFGQQVCSRTTLSKL